jgi:hypothetical protein
MTTQQADPLTAFHWTPQPAAAELVREILAEFTGRCQLAGNMAWRMRDETGTRLVDWLDHLAVPITADLAQRLIAAGFIERGRGFVHDGGIFPTIILRDKPEALAAVKVESIADFLAAWQIPTTIEGPPLSPLRRALIAVEKDAEFWIVERHGYRGLDQVAWSSGQAMLAMQHLERFRCRRRKFENEADGFAECRRLIDAAVADLGQGYAADLFFAAERDFWQRRNRAARAQKARQDRLGLGWANHDHHTYRSSRPHFAALISLLEALGMTCRERFYAGGEAGWGAQILEHPAGFVVFADVDLSPEELRGDFSHDGLEPRQELGTVGLWCALHGDAILQAGMHHLECQFDFQSLKSQLEQTEQIQVMKPFTDFSYLRQAFTEGEVWPVDESRIARLLSSGQITSAQAERFRTQGALGSHLENLERNEGFKGFNQKGVSDIIARTDPRALQGA